MKLMKYKYLAATLLIAGGACLGSCMDDFADVNTNPTVVSKPDPRYLFTQALSNFDGYGYFSWFYDYNNMQRWSQTIVSTGGNENLMTTMSNSGSIGSQVYPVMNLVNELTHVINTTMSEEESAKYTHLKALCKPLMIYLGMLDTDMYGSMAYTEAYQARYTNPPLLKPRYDTQAELFDIWESQLKEAVETLSKDVTNNGNKITQQSLGSQDLIYKGDYNKWLKFANSLRLKLAARLINEDLPRALAIVKDVAKYPIMDGLDDDFIYNKGINDRHMPGGNDMSNRGAASKQLADFMLAHRDPRLRVFFQKNDYNSLVVNAFLEQGKRLPEQISQYVETEVENGKTVFKGWKAPGEPWVRYSGIPALVDAAQTDLHPEYVDYFNKAGTLWKLKIGDSEKTYNPYSALNQFMFDKKVIIEYPDIPGASATQITDLYAWYGMYLSTAEINLYLAEFKLLSKGENIGFNESAQSYLNKGVEYSLKAYDKLASLNNIPYYNSTFGKDRFDKSIKLEDNEVTTLLADPIVTLSGSDIEKLEKVYLQQYIHFVLMPSDQFAMMRRSGCPMRGSSLYPMLDLNPAATAYPIPRRFQITQPTVDDQMGEIKRKAYEGQGFSFGPEPATLNTQRIWYDKKAPNFGEGPKF